jgi:hypothetical protein
MQLVDYCRDINLCTTEIPLQGIPRTVKGELVVLATSLNHGFVKVTASYLQ